MNDRRESGGGVGYWELVEAGIAAQRGHFVDEVIEGPAGAGVLIFSHREDEAMWNLLYVRDLAAALAHEEEIKAAFLMRRREPVWVVPKGTELPAGWWRRGASAWMARRSGGATAARRDELQLRPVEKMAEVDAFNKLYVDVFWEGDASDAALPLSVERPNPDSGVAPPRRTRHWLLYGEGRAVAAATTIEMGELCGIYNVATHPEQQRRGYASEIMRRVMAKAHQAGCEWCFLLTEDETLPPFYERLGFEVVAECDFYSKARVVDV